MSADRIAMTIIAIGNAMPCSFLMSFRISISVLSLTRSATLVRRCAGNVRLEAEGLLSKACAALPTPRFIESANGRAHGAWYDTGHSHLDVWRFFGLLA